MTKLTYEERKERILKVDFIARVYPLTAYGWLKVINIIPKRCLTSHKLIMPFTWVYKGTNLIYGPAGHPPISEYAWLSTEEYLFHRLKGNL